MKHFQGVRSACNAGPPDKVGTSHALLVHRNFLLAIVIGVAVNGGVLAGRKDGLQQPGTPAGFVSPFGRVADFFLQTSPLDISVVKVQRNNLIALLTNSSTNVDFYSVDSAGGFRRVSSVRLSKQMTQSFSCDINSDGHEDILFWSPEVNGGIFLVRSGSSWRPYEIPLPENTRNIVVADINNDRRPDILTFGKSTTGLTVMYGKPRMSFHEPKLLLPDISISDLVVADLNDDRIADLSLVDWLKEELMVFYGIGRGVFSEQVAAKIVGEPELLALDQRKKDKTFRIAVTLPISKEVFVLGGNSAGEFVSLQRFDVPRIPTGITFLEATEDEDKDLVIVSDKELYFSASGSVSSFKKPVTYGIGPISGWAVADLDRDGDPEFVAGDGLTSRLVVLEGMVKPNKKWPDQYSSGSEPIDVVAMDVTNDGLPEICVANAQSATVSIFVNKGRGIFQGQYPVVVEDFCNALRVGAMNGDERFSLITSHVRNNHVAITRLRSDFTLSGSARVPTGQQPQVISVSTLDVDRLQLVIRSHESSRSAIGMSLFEEFQEGKFIERSMRANIPNRVVALTSGDLRNNKMRDLVALSRDRSDTVSVVVGFGTDQFDFPVLTRVANFIDSTGKQFMLFIKDVDTDSCPDIVFFSGPSEGRLGIIYGRMPGEFPGSIAWLKNVQPLNDNCLILDDVNGDNRIDITYLDGEKQAVMVAYQQTDRVFMEPVVVQSAAGVRGIQVAPLKRDGIFDLIMAHSNMAKISIAFDPFRNN